MIPKFRAWLKREKQMVSVVGISFYQDSFDVEEIFVYDQENPHKYGDLWEEPFLPYEFVLMQSTGLKDINGKEIYEGDVVLCEWGEIGDNVYTNAEKTVVDSSPHNLVMLEEADRLQILGNIYENPELKKELMEVIE